MFKKSRRNEHNHTARLLLTVLGSEPHRVIVHGAPQARSQLYILSLNYSRVFILPKSAAPPTTDNGVRRIS